jgi:hypothetical protein
MSWYEVSMKLHLTDMLETSSPADSIIESMTSALVTESSIRTRKPAEIVVSGLAELPREKTFPAIESTITEDVEAFKDTKELQLRRYVHHQQPVTLPPAKPSRQELSQSEKKTKSIRRQLETQNAGKVKPSPESWVPESSRLKSIYRSIAVAEENLFDAMVRETEFKREMRRNMTTDLQKAHLEEELGTKKKELCACCLQKYSYVNLPIKVPQKAIIDIRKKWCNNATDGWWIADDERLSSVPRCYDAVKICLFCSQFFVEQEKYRPSFSSITKALKEKANQEAKQREREYWNPLLMCEKDREKAALEESKMIKENSIVFKDVDPSLSTLDYE